MTLNPQNPLDWYNKGIRLNPQERKKYFEEGLTFDQQFHVFAWVGLGGVFALENKLEDAEKAYKNAAKVNPKQSMIWFNLGIVQFNLAKYSDSENSFMSAVGVDPRSEKSWERLAALRRHLNKLEGAAEAYEKITELNPLNSGAWLNLGTAKALSAKFDEAKNAFLKVVELDPVNKEVWNNLAALYSRIGDDCESEKALLGAIKLDSHNVKLWFELGRIRFKRENLLGAEEAFQNVVKIENTNARNWVALGVIQGKQGKNDTAIKSLSYARTLEPENIEIWLNLGAAYFWSQNLPEAENAYTQATELDPNNYVAWECLGVARAEVGKTFLAEEAFTKTLTLNSSNAHAWENLGITQNKQHKYPQAEKAFKKATELDPSYTRSWLGLGVSREKQKNFESALQAYLEAHQIEPENPEVLLGLGLSCLELNKPEKSREYLFGGLQKFVQLIPQLKPLDIPREIPKFFAGLRVIPRIPDCDSSKVNEFYHFLLELSNKNFSIKLDESNISIPSPFEVVTNWYGSKIATLMREASVETFKKFPTSKLNSLFAEMYDLMDQYKSTALERAPQCLTFWKLIRCLLDLHEKNINLAADFSKNLQDLDLLLYKANLDPTIKELLSRLKSHLNLVNNLLESDGLDRREYQKENQIIIQEIEHLIQEFVSNEFKYPSLATIIQASLNHEKRLLSLKAMALELQESAAPGFITRTFVKNRESDLQGLIDPKDPNLKHIILTQLRENGFLGEKKGLIPSAYDWFQAINFFANLLHRAYNHEPIFRLEAKQWTDELQDMQPWVRNQMDKELEESRHNALVSGDGHADHWIRKIPIESKLLKISISLDFPEMITKEIANNEGQVKREAGETGFGVLLIADVRKEIIDGTVDQSPLPDCIRIYESKGYWIAVFVFQAFQGTPSQRSN